MIPTPASVVPIPSHLSIHEANTLAGGSVVALTAYDLGPSACNGDSAMRRTRTAALVVHPCTTRHLSPFHFRAIVSAVYPKLWMDSEQCLVLAVAKVMISLVLCFYLC